MLGDERPPPAPESGLRRMSLLSLLAEAAVQGFPTQSEEIAVLPAPAGPFDAVLALMGRTIVAAGVPESWVEERVPRDDLSGPMRPDFVTALAEELGATPGSFDVLLAAPGYASRPIIEMSEMEPDGARNERAHGSEARSYTDSESGGVITLGPGLAGRLSLSIELSLDSKFVGRGWKIVEAART